MLPLRDVWLHELQQLLLGPGINVRGAAAAQHTTQQGGHCVYAGIGRACALGDISLVAISCAGDNQAPTWRTCCDERWRNQCHDIIKTVHCVSEQTNQPQNKRVSLRINVSDSEQTQLHH